jgi:hypothetical protein
MSTFPLLQRLLAKVQRSAEKLNAFAGFRLAARIGPKGGRQQAKAFGRPITFQGLL